MAVAVTLVLLGFMAVSPQSALAAQRGHASSGVLPASAKPFGYSLADMTRLLALFTTSGNQPQYYPDTPFQILYVNGPQTDFSFRKPDLTTICEPPGPSCGLFFTEKSGFKESNSFTVRRGKKFFVPVDNADDSPPIVGTFPVTPKQAKRYIFDPAQVGGRGFSITIDSACTSLGPNYVAGPVKTPELLDVPEGVTGGTHMITIGAFLDAMSPGHHTVRIQGGYFGKAIQDTYGFGFIALDFTYSVTVTG